MGQLSFLSSAGNDIFFICKIWKVRSYQDLIRMADTASERFLYLKVHLK